MAGSGYGDQFAVELDRTVSQGGSTGPVVLYAPAEPE
jgi:hypothetical protein